MPYEPTVPYEPNVSDRKRPGDLLGGDLLTEIMRDALDPGYTEAALGPKRDPRSWRSRIGRTSTMAILCVFGFLVVVAYQQAVIQQPAAAKARANLADEVKRRRAETDALQRRANQLGAEVSDRRDQALAGGGDRSEVARLRNQEAVTGLVAVRGKGIVVTVADAPPTVDPVTGRQLASDVGKIYDQDLQEIVNALWLCGGEAITVNGQRLSATSTIRAAGGAILVDFRPVSSPYQVEVIGPDDLRADFEATSTARRFRHFVNEYKMKFTIRDAGSLTLPAAPDPRLRHARPAPDDQSGSVPSPSGGTR